MNLTSVNLNTLITEIPGIINRNNTEIKNYLDVFYSKERGIVISPVNTPGRVKGASGEFVNMVVDNLTVKNQFINRFDNIVTADFDYYNMLMGSVTIGRDPCTYGIDTSIWNTAYEPVGHKIVNINKPYYKFYNAEPIFMLNNNLSQIVGIYFDPSIVGSNPLIVILDPCVGTKYEIDIERVGQYREFICINFDPSWGSTWALYK